MMESFRISGNADSGTNDSSNDEVILAATEFKFSCNLCGKGGHKAKDCPQRNNVKCEHCGRLGHTKATCWKLEANKSKRPEWWNDMAAATADEGKLAPPLNKLECECKPDIAMTVHQCARFSANPMRSHEQAVLRETLPMNSLMKKINVIFPLYLPSPSPRFVIKAREDNQSCIAMAQNPKFSPRTKHIAIKYHHFCKHVITQSNPIGFLDIDYCSTDDQIADIFTKPVRDDIFMRLRQMLLGW